ncbi:hypothetical protein ACFVHB_09195 [Kitasatospora sp. NPDC127111]|uniref:hypothetical protein n=1 Tax=Kitasatospora sp. NPDC127111 TaxID=3345363 RepID=UPI0036453357
MLVDGYSKNSDTAVTGVNDGNGLGGYFKADIAPGLRVFSSNSAGAEFESGMQGQIRLIPRVTLFSANAEGVEVPDLPDRANVGEIIAVTREGHTTCSLWVCILGHGTHPVPYNARWARMQLGPEIEGTGGPFSRP